MHLFRSALYVIQSKELFEFLALAHAAFLCLILLERISLNHGLFFPLILSLLIGVCLSQIDVNIELKYSQAWVTSGMYETNPRSLL